MKMYWDHATRTYTETDDDGTVTLQRPYTAEENAAADERDAQQQALTTAATIKQQAINILLSNQQWRDNTYPQIINGANAIIADATASSQEKQLAQGLKAMANHGLDLNRQCSKLIRLLLQRFDAET